MNDNDDVDDVDAHTQMHTQHTHIILFEMSILLMPILSNGFELNI